MDSSLKGAVLDPVKRSKLSMEERKKIVYELAKWSHGAAEMLQTWSRQDILQILCAEMGKERKYTGLTKLKIIEHLLKVVAEKSSGNQENAVCEQQSWHSVLQKNCKRPRKPDNPSRFVVSATDISSCDTETGSSTEIYCKNAACKAKLNKEYTFCKRCTCCICQKYDDNKDPSLWLTCSSEPPFQGESCNMSCHLECAIKHDKSGIARNGLVSQLDGSFYCISCGKMNDLMSCWRKQLMVAKDTRRVDILCYRISLSQKLLSGTKKYQKLSDIVDDAIRHLEAEVGTLSGVAVKMGRGIVNRMSSGQEIQRLCASAVETFDLMFCHIPMPQDSKTVSSDIIRVKAVSSTTIAVDLGPDTSNVENNVGYTLWHQKADEKKEMAQPTCTLFPPQTRFIVSGLSPATEYIFRVVSFDSCKELSSCEIRLTTNNPRTDAAAKYSKLERIQSSTTNCSSLSNPSSVEDETNNVAPYSDLNDNKTEDYFNYYKNTKRAIGPDLANEPVNSSNASQDQIHSCGSDEEHVTGKVGSVDQSDTLKLEGRHSSDFLIGETISIEGGSDDAEKIGMLFRPGAGRETSLPITPSRKESLKDGSSKKGAQKSHNKAQDNSLNDEHARSSSKKRRSETQNEECVGDGPSGSNLEYYIKVIRQLECKGHIDKSFRQKFLTWYSIRATPQETRVVKAFVDNLIEDPASLAEQIVDTFGEIVSSKKSSVAPPGFCLKLWH